MSDREHGHPQISDDECADFGAMYSKAQKGDGDIFRTSDIPSPPGRPERWAHRIIGERDVSHLQELSVASIESLTGTVIDRSLRPADNQGEPSGQFHAVTAFAVCSTAGERLVSIRCRNERRGADADELALAAFGEYCAAIDAGGLDVVSAPLMCLEPELAGAKGRRTLVSMGISYAIRIDGDNAVNNVCWRPRHEVDTLETLTVATAFDLFWPERDPRTPAIVPVKDLRSTRPGAAGRLEELLFEVPLDGEPPMYFISRPHLPVSATPHEREQAAVALVAGATRSAWRPPAAALRAHEFHHPNVERYCAALKIVNHASTLNATAEKSG